MHIFQSHLESNNLSDTEHDYLTFKNTTQSITFRKRKMLYTFLKII